MYKQVSFSLFPGQAQEYKELVEPSMQSKILRNFLLNDYQLPTDLSIINDGKGLSGFKPEKFAFDQNTDTRLNDLVKQVREAGHKANRSSVMRNVFSELIANLKENKDVLPRERKLHRSMYYFENGTRELLESLISFRNRNATIERFILEEYKVDYNSMFEKPEEPEQILIIIDMKAINKLDKIVKDINTKGVTRTSVMRDVVYKLISKLSHSDSRKLISETKIKKAIYEYKEAFGEDLLNDLLESYEIDRKDDKG